LVDHLKHAAANAENLRNYDEACLHMGKAIEALDNLANVDVNQEKAELQRHLNGMKKNLEDENQRMLHQAAQQMDDNVSESILKRADQYD